MTTFSHSTEEAGGLKNIYKEKFLTSSPSEGKKKKIVQGRDWNHTPVINASERIKSRPVVLGGGGVYKQNIWLLLDNTQVSRKLTMAVSLWCFVRDFLCGLSSLLTNIQYSILTRQWQVLHLTSRNKDLSHTSTFTAPSSCPQQVFILKTADIRYNLGYG